MSTPNYKVLILGLDGATFDLMLPWIDQGHLPNLAKLVRGGAWSQLRSTVPPITPCAWSSFMTGKNPGKHGLFYFAEPVPGSYKLRFTNASFRHGETLWAYLSRQGRKVGVVNVPMTYPPEKVNGYLISGLDTPDEHSPYMFPATLQQELRTNSAGFRLDIRHLGNMTNDARRDDRLNEFRAIESVRTEALGYLQRRYPSDFTMLVYTATDQVQHHFWHYMDPKHDLYDARGAERYANAIRDVYVHLDGQIGSLLAQQGEDTIVMLMSDHGFGPTTNVRVRLNQVLEQAGVLTFARQGVSGKTTRGLAAKLGRLLRSTLSPRTKSLLASWFPGLRVWFEAMGGAAIDYGHTTAFTNEVYRPPSLWLNRKDRFPEGPLDAATLDKALKETEDVLLRLKDPQTDKPVISNVYRARDLYHGPYAEKAPDLIPSWWEDGFLQEQSIPGGPADKLVEHARGPIKGGVEFSGSHRLEGVFSIAGGPVRSGHAFSGAEIIDVAPTVLYLMGLPIPGDMDGRPLLEALDPEFVARNPPRFDRESPAPAEPPPAPETVFNEAEEDMIAKRLQSMGYIE
jgi:predicted AlkP superfamily phosphohydrolase/phosphomutase